MGTCVIATAGADGQPEAATIGFSHDDSFVILFEPIDLLANTPTSRLIPSALWLLVLNHHRTVPDRRYCRKKSTQRILPTDYSSIPIKVPARPKRFAGTRRSNLVLYYTNVASSYQLCSSRASTRNRGILMKVSLQHPINIATSTKLAVPTEEILTRIGAQLGAVEEVIDWRHRFDNNRWSSRIVSVQNILMPIGCTYLD